MNSITNKIWGCNACDNPIVREMDRIAYLKFRGVHGQGFLFHTAFNYKLGEPVERNMTTGLHTIRDMYCGRCNQYVGWRYDKAEHEAESYKIGKFLMEGEMLREVTGLISEIQAKL